VNGVVALVFTITDARNFAWNIINFTQLVFFVIGHCLAGGIGRGTPRVPADCNHVIQELRKMQPVLKLFAINFVFTDLFNDVY
jgi:hypothetical protein